MNDLEWREVPDGYDYGDYCIRRIEGSARAQWRLELSASALRRPASRVRYPSIHVSPQSAKERARCDERDRLRNARVIGHVVIAAVAAGVFTVLLTAMGTIAGFVAAMVAAFVAVRSFAFAVSIKSGDAWGWTRDRGEPERVTWSDHLVLATIERLRRRTMAGIDVDLSSAVRILPPGPPE